MENVKILIATACRYVHGDLISANLDSSNIKISGVVAGEACTVLLRVSTNQMVDEAERSLHDALSLLSQTRTVLGGECAEMLMSCAVENEAW